MEYFIKAMKHYYDFSGRTTKKEFWMFQLSYFALSILVSFIDFFIGDGFIFFLFFVFMLVPSLSIGARRLHDTSRTGWWQLIVLLPIIGFIVLLIFFVQGSHDDNRFGRKP